MKIIAIIYLLGHIGFYNLYASNEWELRYEVNGVPKGIECPDTNNCYISSTTGIPNWLYRTTNQGLNWEMIWETQNNIGVQSNSALSVPDSTNVFLLFSIGGLLKSNDGGYNFTQIPMEGTGNRAYISMMNRKVGFIGRNGYITYDGWETYELLYYKFLEELDNISPVFHNPTFINDSTLLLILRNARPRPNDYYLLKLNINNLDYEYYYIDHLSEGIRDLFIVNDNLMFVCGKSHTLSGGSGSDAIHKSTDAGKTWRRVLDTRTWDKKLPDIPPFGLQSIAFKDSLTGIAVGQFGKILYTYDGGESWTYENNLHESIINSVPPTMIVRYAGNEPIIATFTGHIYKLKHDNLAPKPEDMLTISGRVWEGETGQAGIPVALNTYRITMTDENGFYKFTNLAQGDYTVKALNKYYDGDIPNLQIGYYIPFRYEPEQYEFELTNDTTGIDFNAIDIRKFYSLYGTARDTNGIGIPDIEIQMNSHIYNVIIHKTITDASGNYKFENLEERSRYTITPLTEGYDFTPKHYETPLTSNLHGMDFTAQTKTSVKEIEKPYPITHYISGDKLHINTELNTHNLTIKFYDILGNKVLSTAYKQEIDISIFPSGIYFLNIFDNETLIKTEKIMIIR